MSSRLWGPKKYKPLKKNRTKKSGYHQTKYHEMQKHIYGMFGSCLAGKKYDFSLIIS